MKIVIACLAGEACRYDGGVKRNDAVARLVDAGEAVTVCPEELGALGTPRPPSEIQGGTGADVLDGRVRIVNNAGRDVTHEFVQGARTALKLALEAGAEVAIFKEGSPSCGVERIYDGSFSGGQRPGEGVTTALFRREGIRVVSDETLG